MAEKHTDLFSCRFGGPKSEMGLTGRKPSCQWGCLPFGGPKGSPLFHFFQLLKPVWSAWLMALCSIFKARNMVESSPSHAAFSLGVFCLPLPFKDPCNHTGPTQLFQDNLPIFKVSWIAASSIFSLHSPLPSNVACSQGLGTGAWTDLGEALFSHCTSSIC